MSERQAFLLAVALLTVLHLGLALLLPLSGDEAYYWDCSRHLDWSYFDQPPLVIWAMVPFRALLGDTVLAVRAPALVASLLVALFLLPLVRRLGGGPRQAASAYLLLHAMPAFLLGSSYASTDVAMTAAYVGATWAAVALAQGERRAWYGFAVALGLGFLAKFPAVLVLPALVPALLRRDDGGRWAEIRTARPWLAGLVAALLAAPVWLWAAEHNWDNLRFQLVSRHSGGGLTLAYLAEFLAANLLLASPPLAIALAVAWGRAWRRRTPGWNALGLAAVTPLAFFALTSLRERVGAHWGVPGLVVATTALALTTFRSRPPLVVAGTIAGLLSSAVVLVAVLAPEPLLAVEWSYRGRPTRISTHKLGALVGNADIVAEAGRRLAPDELLGAESYTNVHLFAFLSGGELDTRLAHVKGGKHGLASLYWYTLEELRRRDVLFVTEKRQVDDRLRRVFAEVEELAPFEVVRSGRVVRTVRFLRCRNLRHPEGVFTRLGVTPGSGFGPPASGYGPDG